ncbi:MAG TPA: HepT-like ribonuclease domain-containing protein [Planctomycetota bacterium]|nr:HepT-like ribonuclease domain-containing protein [Planctomycetota bacterium]
MQHDDLAYLGHMRDNAETVRRLLTGRTRAKFDADETLQLAVTHLIQRIGEAAGKVSASYRDSHSEIPGS